MAKNVSSFVRTLLSGQGKVVFVVGLPGSGKSFLSKSLAKTLNNTELFDDFVLDRDNQNKLKKAIQAGKTCIINHPMLVDEAKRAEYGAAARTAGAKEIEWIYFENDPTACCVNHDRRMADGSYRLVLHNLHIQNMSLRYTIPEGSDVRPVWKKPE